MNRALEEQALTQVPEMLAHWLDVELAQVHREREKKDIDLLVRVGTHRFAIEWKSAGTIAVINAAIRQLKGYAQTLPGGVVPVIAVPFMGPAGRELCKEQGISWLDLSGNAHVVAPGLRIHVVGNTNKFKQLGRPKNLFAPKSSRIIRQLLLKPSNSFSQRELANETRVNEALVSRVVRELEAKALIIRDEAGAVKPKDPELLLDAWHEAYSFRKHQIIEGFIAERSSDAILQGLSKAFKKSGVNYAATGLAGAWLLTHFANFRIVTFYLKSRPSKELLQQVRFKEQDLGGNVWLVVPNDEDVFTGSSEREGIVSTHPLQVYLDLKGHPERAKEAAEAVRKEYLRWTNHAG
jgi:hypothetical protein